MQLPIPFHAFTCSDTFPTVSGEDPTCTLCDCRLQDGGFIKENVGFNSGQTMIHYTHKLSILIIVMHHEVVSKILAKKYSLTKLFNVRMKNLLKVYVIFLSQTFNCEHLMHCSCQLRIRQL